MKKSKQFNSRNDKLTPDQVAEFMESFKQAVTGQDKKSKLISLRVPENILHSFKVLADIHHQKYQTIIVELMRKHIEDSRK